MKNGLSVIFCLSLLLLTTVHSNAQEDGTKNINNPSQSPESSHQGSSAFSKFILAIFLIALFGLLGLVCYYRFQIRKNNVVPFTPPSFCPNWLFPRVENHGNKAILSYSDIEASYHRAPEHNEFQKLV